MMRELWKTVPSNPNYAVSNIGRIKRLTRGPRTRPGYILSTPKQPKTGYLVVQLFLNGAVKNRMVHSVVAEAFIGPRPLKHDVNHKNFDRTDNRLSNLEYLSRPDNIAHTKLHKRHTHGSMVGVSKLSEADVIKIRLLAKTHGALAISKLFGVTRWTIRRVIRRVTWSHLD